MKRVSTSAVTDHALLRWLERVHGIDVEFFRRCMLAETEDALRSGASSFVLGDHRYVMGGGRVITVMDAKHIPAEGFLRIAKREQRA